MPLLIGTTPATLQTIKNPSAMGDIAITYNDNKQRYNSLNNQVFIRQTGVFRRSFNLTWDFNSKSDNDSLMSIVNVPMMFYVRLSDIASTWYEGYTYITLNSQLIQANTNDNFKSKVTLNFEQII